MLHPGELTKPRRRTQRATHLNTRLSCRDARCRLAGSYLTPLHVFYYKQSGCRIEVSARSIERRLATVVHADGDSLHAGTLSDLPCRSDGEGAARGAQVTTPNLRNTRAISVFFAMHGYRSETMPGQRDELDKLIPNRAGRNRLAMNRPLALDILGSAVNRLIGGLRSFDSKTQALTMRLVRLPTIQLRNSGRGSHDAQSHSFKSMPSASAGHARQSDYLRCSVAFGLAPFRRLVPPT